MNEELKRCPFCGGEAITTVNDLGQWSVYCENNDCFMNYNQMQFTEEKEAIEAWNRRVADER